MRNSLLEKKVDKIINEELGIADEVLKLTNLIEEKVYSLIQQGIDEKIFNIKTKLSDVNVDYIYKEFSSNEEAIEWFNETRRFDGYSYQTNTIYLSLYSLNGRFRTTDLTDTIMHECNHYWECKNSGKTQSGDRYDKIQNGIFNQNPCISEICNILYYCDKHEINSFVSGTYATAIKKMKKYKSYRQFIADNGINDLYLMLRNTDETIKKYEEEQSVYYFLAKYWIVSNNILNCDVDEVGKKVSETANYFYEYLIERIGKAYALYIAKIKEYEENKRDASIRMQMRRLGFIPSEK